MVQGKTENIFNIGDKVTNITGDRTGTVTRIGSHGDAIFVKWDGGMQELTELTDVKKA